MFRAVIIVVGITGRREENGVTVRRCSADSCNAVERLFRPFTILFQLNPFIRSRQSPTVSKIDGRGIVRGVSATEFAPTLNVTREQLATILYRYAQSKGEGFTGSWMFLLPFDDAQNISGYASEAMHWCVMKDIIGGKYGNYKLMADYGDNFREGTAYENNAESLFEVQFLDYGMGGTDEEWTPVNISKNSTQGHAVESNYGSGELGSWGDLAASPWLYELFKAESCTDGTLDPRLYWTIVSYEPEYSSYTGAKTAAYPNGDPRSNIVYMNEITKTPMANTQNGGMSIAKFTNARNNIYSTIVTGLHCGVNLRLMRYSDVLLRAAECENEVNGPTQQAIDWINQVRRRVALPDLQLADFNTADKLFEQIANVERPKEFGCENGRGIDLIRWGFFYSSDRLDQIKQHSCFMLDGSTYTPNLTIETADNYSYKYYSKGHEYFPIYQGTLNANPNITGNSANTNTDNGEAFRAKGWTVRPVVKL